MGKTKGFISLDQELANNKQYYTISEVARLFDVSTSLLRYWEKEFTQLKPKKNQQGIRKYTQADIKQFRTIYTLLKEQGYTIRGAKEALKARNIQFQDQHELIHALQEIKTFLVDLKDNIQQNNPAT